MDRSFTKTAPILVTGGAGFIGANFVLGWVKSGKSPLVNLDLLTYAGCLKSLSSIEGREGYRFIKGDVADKALVASLLDEVRPQAIIHFAAETHVDRSLADAAPFLHSNVIGTANLLEEALAYWKKEKNFRFIHISTDEVYGTLEEKESPWKETAPLLPNSPYAASKASSDHFVRAYFHSYGLPAIITRCTNNFGPFQFPEKLIPLTILNALQGKAIPLYGDGHQRRNWLYVEDHCRAIEAVLERGKPGEVYHIGSRDECRNIDLVQIICEVLDELAPKRGSYKELITFVKDRPGHDRRYALDCTKIEKELGWQQRGALKDRLKETIQWYLTHTEWRESILSGSYRDWISAHYGDTLS